MMNIKSLLSQLLLTIIVLVFSITSSYQAALPDQPVAKTDSKQLGQVSLMESFGDIPLSFEANQGQIDGQVKFLSRGNGYSLFLTPTEAVIALQKSRPANAVNMSFVASGAPDTATTNTPSEAVEQAVIRMQLIDANANPTISGLDELPGKVNYIIGNNPADWETEISTFSKVEYKDVYPGIDLIYYGNQQQLEYDFVVNPGAKPSTISLDFGGVEDLKVDRSGALILHIASEKVVLPKPYVYQEVNGIKLAIVGGYQLSENSQVSFLVESYDPTQPLIIDPVVVYSTFLGGNGLDVGESIAVDNSGNAYVSGTTLSSDFPTTPGAFDSSFNPGGQLDAFVTVLNPSGSALVYSTFLGGNGSDHGSSIAVDNLGNAYVSGTTHSADFPTTPGVFDSNFNSVGEPDYFVVRLNASGIPIYSTRLAEGEAVPATLAVDSSGNAYLTGIATSPDFPTTPGAFDTSPSADRDTFVSKVNPTGTALIYSTRLGGSFGDRGNSIAVDSDGSAYVTGETTSLDFPTTPGAFDTSFGGYKDVFVTKLSSDGSNLIYSTLLSGEGGEENEQSANSIAIDHNGNAYITGYTYTSNFPTTPSAFDTSFNGDVGSGADAFVSKLNPNGTTLIYSTFLGGSGNDDEPGVDIAVDNAGNAYVTGITISPDFPTTPGSFPHDPYGNDDAFVTKLNPDGSALVYSWLFGGSDTDRPGAIALDNSGNAYVTGLTFAFSDIGTSDFPTTSGAFDTTFNSNANSPNPIDAFVVKISDQPPNQPPTVSANGPYEVVEGEPVQVSATGNDPENENLTYAWDLDNDGTFETPGRSTTFSAATLNAPSSHIIRVQATDQGGLTATDEATVNVIYSFTGFFQPIDNPPFVNVIKAGRGVAMKFSLNGDQGLSIFSAGYPISQSIDCDTSAPLDNVEETVAVGQSSLSYDPVADQYSYIWKTNTAWAGTCRQFIMRLNDGTEHIAYFKFK